MSYTHLVLKDRFGDKHAEIIYREANPETIKREALDFASRLGIDDEETLAVGIVWATDPGAARLKPDADEDGGNGGITWLYWLFGDGEFQSY